MAQTLPPWVIPFVSTGLPAGAVGTTPISNSSNASGVQWTPPPAAPAPAPAPVVVSPEPVNATLAPDTTGYAKTLCDLGFCEPPSSQVGRYVSNGSRSGILRSMPVGESVADALALNRLARLSGFNSYSDALSGGREGQFTEAQGSPVWAQLFKQGIVNGLNPTAAAASANAQVATANPQLGAGYTRQQATMDEAEQQQAAARSAGTAAALHMPEIAGLGYAGGLSTLSGTGVTNVRGQNGEPYFETTTGVNVGVPGDLNATLAIPTMAQQPGGILYRNLLQQNRAEQLLKAELQRYRAQAAIDRSADANLREAIRAGKAQLKEPVSLTAMTP